jgi:hypothetical protein
VDYGKFSLITIPTISFIYKKNQKGMQDQTGHRGERGQDRKKDRQDYTIPRGGGNRIIIHYLGPRGQS